MIIKSATYLTSAAQENAILRDNCPEVAFVGRSNVGKSSLINALCGQKGLAKTSSTPGLTKMINYFCVNDGQLRIVDLPGYGYAQTGQKHIANWAGLMEKYLLSSPSLRTVFVLLDCRHRPTDLDKTMLQFLDAYKIPYAIVATKVDKLAKSKIPQSCTAFAKALNVRRELVLPFSAQTLQGKDTLLQFLDTAIEQA